MTFESDKGDAGESMLNANGTYAAKALPIGEYRVFILPLTVKKKADPKGPVVGVEMDAPNIPEKYRKYETTDLKATILQGKNAHIFDMKP